MPVGEEVAPQVKARSNTFARVAKYTAVKLVALFVTVVIGIYLTVLIANMGGYVDEIRRGAIREGISVAIFQDQSPEIKSLSSQEKNELIQKRVALEEHRLGLDRPFIVRSFVFLVDALMLDLGRAQLMISDSGSKLVRNIILERLPPTLLLMGSSQLVLFFASVYLALILSRQYGSFFDRIMIALSPTSAAPSWFYGIFFILIFASVFRVLPFGGMVDAPPPDNPVAYSISLLKHLILPAGALIVSAFFISIYNWRTFFLIYSSEDYVEMAKMKGLTDREIERKYILRPTLPNIITQFALLLIGLWTGAIITETVFNWPGLGRALFQAIGLFDTPVIVGSTIIFAYLLAITVFLLDFVYALVDPRVKIGGSSA